MSSRPRQRYAVQFNLFTLRRQLEIGQGRKYTWVEIATGADLNRKTVERMAQNLYRRVDLATLEGLLAFFNNEGLEIGISDLFTVVPSAAESPEENEYTEI